MQKEGEGREGTGRRHWGPSECGLLILPSGRSPEYKECFSLYDKQQRGKIKATDLLVLMRCLGASPTPGEVQQHLRTHGIGEWAGPELATEQQPLGLVGSTSVVLGGTWQQVQMVGVQTAQKFEGQAVVRAQQPRAVQTPVTATGITRSHRESPNLGVPAR